MIYKVFEVVLLAMSPIAHSGAIPLGLAIKLNPTVVLASSIVGNLVSVSALLLGLEKLDRYLKGTRFYEVTIEKIRRSCSRSIDRYGALGLVLFVVTPGVGSWTGCIAASITGMNKKIALMVIALGVLISEILILGISLGFISLWNNFFIGL